MIGIMLSHLQVLPNITRTFRKGQYLFHQKDRVEWIFLVESGEARLVRQHRNGGVVVLQRAQTGSFLAEASLFATRYHCDAIATTSVSVRVLPRSAMKKLFETKPDFAIAWTAHISDEVRHARLRSEILSLKSVSERLYAWTVANEGFPPKGTWKSVAQDIGTSPEALYREIRLRR
jgi:CRP/FNR family transcriptional regulator, dissimilatory nitrate respiration regulator